MADSLLCAETYAQWHYARPGATIDAARQGVSHALDGLELSSVTAELAAAEMAMANDPSPANVARMTS